MALTSIDMGLDSKRLLVLTTVVPVRDFKEASRATDLYRALLGDLRQMPGVESAAGVRSIPSRIRSFGGYSIEGAGNLENAAATAPQAVLNVVTPLYFDTLRVPIRTGRDFADQDRKGAPMVAIINEELARRAGADKAQRAYEQTLLWEAMEGCAIREARSIGSRSLRSSVCFRVSPMPACTLPMCSSIRR